MISVYPQELFPGDNIKIWCKDTINTDLLISGNNKNISYYTVVITDIKDKIRCVGDLIHTKKFIHPDQFLIIDGNILTIKTYLIPSEIERIRIYCQPEITSVVDKFKIGFKNKYSCDGAVNKGWVYNTEPMNLTLNNLVQVFQLNRYSLTFFDLGCVLHDEPDQDIKNLFKKHL